MTRPFVFINSAMSADGKISSFERSQVRISGQADKARVDLLRAESDAVMVGVGTVLADDPGLRVKSASFARPDGRRAGRKTRFALLPIAGQERLPRPRFWDRDASRSSPVLRRRNDWISFPQSAR